MLEQIAQEITDLSLGRCCRGEVEIKTEPFADGAGREGGNDRRSIMQLVTEMERVFSPEPQVLGTGGINMSRIRR